MQEYQVLRVCVVDQPVQIGRLADRFGMFPIFYLDMGLPREPVHNRCAFSILRIIANQNLGGEQRLSKTANERRLEHSRAIAGRNANGNNEIGHVTIPILLAAVSVFFIFGEWKVQFGGFGCRFQRIAYSLGVILPRSGNGSENT